MKFEDKVIEIDNITIAYKYFGKKDAETTIIFFPQGMRDSEWMINNVIPEIKSFHNYNIIIPDPLGRGRSSNYESLDETKINHISQAYLKFLSKLDIDLKDVILIGKSISSAIVMKIIRDIEDKNKSLDKFIIIAGPVLSNVQAKLGIFLSFLGIKFLPIRYLGDLLFKLAKTLLDLDFTYYNWIKPDGYYDFYIISKLKLDFLKLEDSYDTQGFFLFNKIDEIMPNSDKEKMLQLFPNADSRNIEVDSHFGKLSNDEVRKINKILAD